MIDFVQAFTIAGENRKDEGPKLSEKEKKRQSIKEVRESLPIYHYREGLLDAIEEHQGKFIFRHNNVYYNGRHEGEMWYSCELKTYICTNIPITVEQIFTTNYCQTEIPRIPIFHVPWS